MNYTKYDKNTGKIISSLYVSDYNDLQKNLKINEAVIQGEFDETYYISNLKPIKLPTKPEGVWVFDYTTQTWTPDSEAQWAKIREMRNYALAKSDWTQMPDVSLTTKEAWATYRQDLRDITDQTDPFNIVWPTPPN